MPVLTIGELMAESRAITRVSLNGSEPSSKLTYVCVISCEFLYTFGVKLLFSSDKLSFSGGNYNKKAESRYLSREVEDM